MRKLLLGLFLLFPSLLLAQSPPLLRQYSLSATGTTSTIDVRGKGINYYKLQWVFDGTTVPSACTAVLQTSQDSNTWSNTISGDCSSNGISSATQSSANYIRINLSTFTAASPGNIVLTIIGDYSSSGGVASSVEVTAFPDNEPFNLAQINGTATDDNNGAIGTGTIRVAHGTGTTFNSCNDESQVTSVAIDTASSGNVELVALTASSTIFVCGYNFIASGTVSVQLIYGTGSACATGETNLTGAYSLIAQTGISVPNTGAMQLKTAVSNALCIELSDAIQVSGVVTYVKRVP